MGRELKEGALSPLGKEGMDGLFFCSNARGNEKVREILEPLSVFYQPIYEAVL